MKKVWISVTNLRRLEFLITQEFSYKQFYQVFKIGKNIYIYIYIYARLRFPFLINFSMPRYRTERCFFLYFFLIYHFNSFLTQIQHVSSCLSFFV